MTGARKTLRVCLHRGKKLKMKSIKCKRLVKIESLSFEHFKLSKYSYKIFDVELTSYFLKFNFFNYS